MPTPLLEITGQGFTASKFPREMEISEGTGGQMDLERETVLAARDILGKSLQAVTHRKRFMVTRGENNKNPPHLHPNPSQSGTQ